MQKQEEGDTAFSKITPEHHQLQIRTVGGKGLVKKSRACQTLYSCAQSVNDHDYGANTIGQWSHYINFLKSFLLL